MLFSSPYYDPNEKARHVCRAGEIAVGNWLIVGHGAAQQLEYFREGTGSFGGGDVGLLGKLLADTVGVQMIGVTMLFEDSAHILTIGKLGTMLGDHIMDGKGDSRHRQGIRDAKLLSDLVHQWLDEHIEHGVLVTADQVHQRVAAGCLGHRGAGLPPAQERAQQAFYSAAG